MWVLHMIITQNVSCQVVEGLNSVSKGDVFISLLVENLGSEACVVPPLTKVGVAYEVQLSEQVVLGPCEDGVEVSVRFMVSDDSHVSVNDAEVPKPSGLDYNGGGTHFVCNQHRELFVFPNGTKFLLPPGISLKDLSTSEAVLAAELIRKHEAAFSKSSLDLGYNYLIPHEISVVDDRPVNLPYRRIIPSQMAEVKNLLQDLLDRNVIRKSSSPYASPVVLVRKKDGQLRLCIDYRSLNSKTKRDVFPLPRIDETLESMGGAKLFSYLAHGYFQVAMHPNSVFKTAFRVPWGLYEFLRLPQGLCNSPSTFQRIMQFLSLGI